MLASATGGQSVEAPRGMESFIPSRAPVEEPKETTEDILTKGATWLSEIKRASVELKQANEKLEAKRKPATSPVAAAAKAASEEFDNQREAEERREAFSARRADSSPSTYAPRRLSEPGGSAAPIPVDAPVEDILDAIAFVESRGSGDYSAVGPVVEKGMYKGQRALGRYQVMPGNIASWTKAAVGRSYTPEEFLASPEIQDAVATHQLSLSRDKHGTWEDAASVWFTGRPVSQAGNASDGFTTAPAYIDKFRRGFRRT